MAVQWSPPSTVRKASDGTAASRFITVIHPVSMSSPGSRSPMSWTRRPVSRWPSSVTGGITAESSRMRCGARAAPLR